MPNYCLAICGPPGSGKSEFCKVTSELLRKLGRKVKVINLDPGNDALPYTPDSNIDELVQITDVMQDLKCGPNGALMFCMEYLEKHFGWLKEKLSQFDSSDTFVFIDFPGQVELYTHHRSVPNILRMLREQYMVCAIYMVDAYCCKDPGSFLSYLTTTLVAMAQLYVPQINVLSKIDMIPKYEKKLVFGLEFYTEVLNLDRLVGTLDKDPVFGRYRALNHSLAGVIKSFGLVSFAPCTVSEERSLFGVIKMAELALGYASNPEAKSDEDHKLDAIIKSKDTMEMRELVSSLNEKYVYSK